MRKMGYSHINVYGIHCKVIGKNFTTFGITRVLDKEQFDKFLRKKKLNKIL